jgi:uncharacterized protein YjiS (DUF1127 family)
MKILNRVKMRIVERKFHDAAALAQEKEIRQAISVLKSRSDRILEDIGMPRDQIAQMVRHGEAANDDDFDQRVA